jgi:hypothetical protein
MLLSLYDGKSVSLAGSETRSSFPMITQVWTVEKMDRKFIKFIMSKLFAIHKFLTAAKPQFLIDLHGAWQQVELYCSGYSQSPIPKV